MFTNGSSGSERALIYNAEGTQKRNPEAPKILNPGLNPPGDNGFNFTTINIAGSVTIILSNRYRTGGVYCLAQGAVTIDGIIALRGEGGAAPSDALGDFVKATW